MSTKIALFEAVIILILFGVIWIQRDIAKDREAARAAVQSIHQEELKQSEARRIAQQAHSDSVILAERSERAKDKAKDSLREVSYNREKTASKATIAELRKQRANFLGIPDSLTQEIEAEFIAQQARDSVEIATLRANATHAAESFQSEIKAIEDKFEAERETSLKKDLVIIDLETNLAISERKLKGWKVLCAVLAGIIVYEEVKN